MKKNEDHERESVHGKATLPVAVEQEVLRFMEFHPAARFRKNLRSLFLDFLMYRGSVEAVYLRDLVEDLDGLFDLLDVMDSAEQPG
ncbi:MAG TPA: hypothetical protein VKZ86_14705 [Cyclobacteriaceae bacterium]|nr:hypothetical protein [Cyclobacteriaceae bacterium]